VVFGDTGDGAGTTLYAFFQIENHAVAHFPLVGG
jgi:hypothetical protein